MKALRTHAVGGPDTLTLDEVDVPTPGPGQVLVAVKACAVNFPDTLMIRDLYQFKPQRPYAPGGEIAGVIEAVGEGVTAYKVGDKVLSGIGNGGMAEKVVVDAARLFPVPDGVSFQQAASLLMTYGTTIHGLKDRGHIKPGDTMLVLGAAGGVGLSAVELGKAYGARVIAAVSSEEKAQVAREMGADDVVIYGRAPFDKDQSKALAEQFKAACGPNGADIVYDIVGGDYSEPALRAIAWEGRFLVVGFPAGIAKMPLNLTLLKSCDICGVFWGAFVARSPKENAAHVAELFELLKAGKINPRVSATFPLERGGEAIALLESRAAIGKVVVTMA
ncbi:NADPH:quinone oxidoreductase family protein [Novosphingobium sp.]|jgi:NADPH:quinone reductase-like Zn-dependent oxidoreductase|uniref:NADPH:quinone oxidoreductase family protein n=1 Tax=Novosphingobium sp. TaxID=1874826 RepID=UPI0022BC09A7|nr:NADPH:quinone oxidoreductase family protein [Novosphingobium sp.]MCZ8019871.1 NADPH:quinone oxidoreductase family protein [Novosphingobium sp.]MCZ8035803.1 NADPH:quinone oxidoreductase family protein [Novosphingobium sp.]MCZ8052680.1 NADPH:quinone oxidoreductase family protein [Novosphingobium sp.]MCZ8060784.1 NADPH:quinone oxidoreductase family protein [Novosphingobium sp.]MCZ8233356.1 NADPH:quinone oxidoreductase family protein [Novosphingobium sp.]